jgi:hypothetical protein
LTNRDNRNDWSPLGTLPPSSWTTPLSNAARSAARSPGHCGQRSAKVPLSSDLVSSLPRNVSKTWRAWSFIIISPCFLKIKIENVLLLLGGPTLPCHQEEQIEPSIALNLTLVWR